MSFPTLDIADFLTNEVSSAKQQSEFGYHFGPIPNNNRSWVPKRQAEARAAGLKGKPSYTKHML
jgi:hypothetical protein